MPGKRSADAPPSEVNRVLEACRLFYFACRSEMDANKRAELDERFKSSANDPSTYDETLGLLIDACSNTALREWRNTLETEYGLLLELQPAPIPPIDDNQLRSRVGMLLALVARLRAVRKQLSIMRNKCCAAGLMLAVVYFVLGLISVGATGSGDGVQSRFISIVVIVLLLGGLGGLISSLSRLYTLEWRGPSLLTYTHIDALRRGVMLNLLLASFEGVVFALILYVFFTAGFFGGGIFPQIHWSAHDGSWKSYVQYGGPASPVDTGKLFVWSFIAGFSERLVPDLMKQLASQATLQANQPEKPVPQPAEPNPE